MITSLANPTIKRLRALRQRKAREESGLCLVEGIRLVAEAVQCGAEVEHLLVAPALLTSPFARELVAAQSAAGTSVLELSPEVFASLAQKEDPQGLAAVVRWRFTGLTDLPRDRRPGPVALLEPADPGNLGTIIRTADAVGAAGVIILGPGVDPYDPAALRASMGAVFALPLVRASWEEFTAWKRATGLPLIGTSDRAPTHFQSIVYPQPAVLLMGSEREGLSSAHQALCDLMVAIPMRGRSDSLNLAVATGVMLYELLRQCEADGAATCVTVE
ncbi:MAG: RNA methyltransferase [Oscillochloridaceae bacterium]|nr:RNA methyltransferase [Chloroflexaceae bacterium]MDW8389363.1 RNA methyltransferase [Oscillochloridaceae bacterium]